MKLALGTVQFGLPYGISNKTGQVPEATVKSMLDLAGANGINVLDTAIAYGESESVLGKSGVQDFQIVTKLPPVPEGCADIRNWVQEQVDTSRHRLGVNMLYGLLLHRPDQLLGSFGRELYRSLKDLKDGGKTKKIGISVYSPKELDLFIPRFQFDLIQAPFNLIDRQLQTTGCLKRLKDQMVEIHTRSAFLQGLLLMSPEDFPKKFLRWSKLWDKWHDWLLHHNVSPVQACMSFPLSFPEIDHVVVGADNPKQLEEIIIVAKRNCLIDFPDIHSEEEELVNPACWDRL